MGHTKIDINAGPVRPIRWVGSSHDDLSRLDEDVRRKAGYELFAVQQGRRPSDVKPMQTVGRGVQEIRIHTRREHRVLFVARFDEAVYVLHVFEKRSQRTSVVDLERGRTRLQEVERWRRQSGL